MEHSLISSLSKKCIHLFRHQKKLFHLQQTNLSLKQQHYIQNKILLLRILITSNPKKCPSSKQRNNKSCCYDACYFKLKCQHRQNSSTALHIKRIVTSMIGAIKQVSSVQSESLIERHNFF